MATYSAASFDSAGAIFFKTAAGLQEIQNRTLGLPALIRRVLVLVDGKRSSKELAAFAGGEENINEALCQLVAHGCIDAPGVIVLDAEDSDLAALPDAALRSAKDIDMARNFMINTTNSICGQNQRLSLIKAVLACQGAYELRQLYSEWVSTISAMPAGARRLPELREKLFVVL